MSRLWLIALLVAVLCSGCLGVGDDDERPASSQPVVPIDDGVSDADAARPVLTIADAEPTRAALAARPSAALRKQLDAGAVALVDLKGAIGIRPTEISFAKGGRLLDLKWRRWTDRDAEATGRMEGVACDPDCARGRLITARAVIRLAKPVACPRGRFFDYSVVEVVSDDPDAGSNSWLAAPC